MNIIEPKNIPVKSNGKTRRRTQSGRSAWTLFILEGLELIRLLAKVANESSIILTKKEINYLDHDTILFTNNAAKM